MSEIAEKPPAARNFWLIDIFVLVFFLSTAITGLYLFRRDLMRTIEARDEEPVGIIIIRNNVVQRRHEDRMIWDRLYVDSFVYSGDLVRAAEISSASIHIDENKINLNENTLIRIQYSMGRSGPLEIELKEGNISLASGTKDSDMFISLMGNKVYASPGTVLDAEASQAGIKVQINEGKASLVTGGQAKELTEGSVLAKDSKGEELLIPAAVVKRPVPNASFLKSHAGLLPVTFLWTRVNLDDSERIKLEISGDKNFLQDVFTVDDLVSRARAVFDTGIWNWRLCAGDTVLSSGQLTVADGSGPELLSPVSDSVIRYKGNLPQLRFQWEPRAGAVNYIIEISDSQEFHNLKLNKQSSSTSFIYSGLGEGVWYWRVKPVFSSIWEGSSSYSDYGFFKVEEISAPQSSAAAVMEVEVPETPPVRKPPAVIPPEPQTPETRSVSVTQSAPKPRSMPETRYMPETRPAPGPQPQPAPAALANSRTPPSNVYIVLPGDTLARIAAKVYGNALRWPELVEANGIKNPDLIYIDQALYIP